MEAGATSPTNKISPIDPLRSFGIMFGWKKKCENHMHNCTYCCRLSRIDAEIYFFEVIEKIFASIPRSSHHRKALGRMRSSQKRRPATSAPRSGAESPRPGKPCAASRSVSATPAARVRSVHCCALASRNTHRRSTWRTHTLTARLYRLLRTIARSFGQPDSTQRGAEALRKCGPVRRPRQPPE